MKSNEVTNQHGTNKVKQLMCNNALQLHQNKVVVLWQIPINLPSSCCFKDSVAPATMQQHQQLSMPSCPKRDPLHSYIHICNHAGSGQCARSSQHTQVSLVCAISNATYVAVLLVEMLVELLVELLAVSLAM